MVIGRLTLKPKGTTKGVVLSRPTSPTEFADEEGRKYVK